MSTYAQEVPKIIQAFREETAPEPPFSGEEPKKTVYVYPTVEGGLYFTPTPLDEEPEETPPPQPKDSETPGMNTQSNTIAHVTVVFYLFLVFSCLFLQLSMIFNAPTATIYLLLNTQPITTTAAIKVQGRALTPLTLSQSLTTAATGKGHQDATQAHGYLTFYNGSFVAQTIAAGTKLTGQDGVQVITNERATIPPITPPVEGEVTVSAHAVDTGPQGNISAYDIHTTCCFPSVIAQNTTAFTGGQNAKDYTVVTKADIQNAALPLKATLLKSEQAALNAQLNTGEALIAPPCREQIKSDHRPGEEAAQVTVTVSETCSSVAYDAHQVDANATQMIHDGAMKRLGTGYQLTGDVTIRLLHVTIVDTIRGIATIAVKLDAIYVYHLSPGETRQLLHLIAGKTKQQAQALLLQLPGVAGAVITTKGNNVFPPSDAATLPDNPQAITIVVVERV